ncbi:MAG: lysostaphin resistance A-like protein [Sarcina sp.]
MKIKRGPILRASLFFLFIMVWPMVGGFIVGPFIPATTSYPVRLIISHIIMFILPAIGYVLVTRQKFKRVFKLNKIGLKEILIAIVIGFVAQPVMSFFAYIASFFFTNDVAGMMNDLNSTPLWIMIIMIGVTPSISEEITMRGIILSGFDFKNKHIAAIMSGLVFGIIHMNPHQFLYAFVMGVIFGYMVRAANSIFVAMIAHFTINTSQLLLQRALTSFQDVVSESGVSTSEHLDPQQAMDMLNSVGFGEKIALGCFYGAIAIVGFFIIRALINVLEKSRVKRTRYEIEKNSPVGEYARLEDIDSRMDPSFGIDTMKEYGRTREEIKNEKLFNIPFILGIVVFIVLMVVNMSI